MPKELFDVFDGHPFDGDHCFLCGVNLTESNRTVEHVFPRWLQDAFGVRDRTITLLNRSRIAYRNLVIPCCQDCNGVHLSRLENRVRTVILDDTRSLTEINDQDLNAWTSKLLLGILWKELELSFDRKNPDFGPILPPEVMANFRMLHFFMQSCRKSMTFHGLDGGFPNSLLRVECKRDYRYGPFDYLDDVNAHSVAIRLGNKGIIGIFDGGLHKINFPDFAKMMFEEKPLHPVQFQEVFAKLTYKSLLSLRVPFYVFSHNERLDIHDVSLMAFDTWKKEMGAVALEVGDSLIVAPAIPPDFDGPAYSDWSQADYASVLAALTGTPYDRLFVPPDLVATTLRNDDGTFADIPALESSAQNMN